MTPTQQQIKHRNRLLVQALKANKKKAKHAMSNKAGGHCCLCVAEKVALANGCKVEYPNSEGELKCKLTDRFTPIQEIHEWYGWGSKHPIFFYTDNDMDVTPATLNDSDHNVPHSIIAEFFANKFVHPSKPKWSERATKLITTIKKTGPFPKSN